MVKEKTIVVGKEFGDEYEGEYILRRWNVGKRDQALEKASEIPDITVEGENAPSLVRIHVNPYRLNHEMLLATLVKAPFEVTEESIVNLDPDLFDRLIVEARNLMRRRD